jgi:hypothetical protein
MRWKQVEDEPKTFALIFETGDEIATVLQQFARRQRLGGSSFKAIGALSHAKLGWFKWETKKYAALLSTQRQLGFASGYEYHRIMPRIETAAPAAKNKWRPRIPQRLGSRRRWEQCTSWIRKMSQLRDVRPCCGLSCRGPEE